MINIPYWDGANEILHPSSKKPGDVRLFGGRSFIRMSDCNNGVEDWATYPFTHHYITVDYVSGTDSYNISQVQMTKDPNILQSPHFILPIPYIVAGSVLVPDQAGLTPQNINLSNIVLENYRMTTMSRAGVQARHEISTLLKIKSILEIMTKFRIAFNPADLINRYIVILNTYHPILNSASHDYLTWGWYWTPIFNSYEYNN